MPGLFFDDYETPVYRPPSEAESFILRVTRGCAHNHCTYCNMYRGVQFEKLTDEEIIVPRRFFTKYIQYIYDFIKTHMDSGNPPFDIFLITDSNASLPRDCSIFTMDSLFAYIYSYSINKYLMITMPAIAADMYRYIKTLWDELPEENHYTKSSLLLLKKLLDMLS